MPIFIVLSKYTTEGVQKIKDAPERAKAAQKIAESVGAKIKSVYYTFGRYDFVSIIEAPSLEAAMKGLFIFGGGGIVRYPRRQRHRNRLCRERPATDLSPRGERLASWGNLPRQKVERREASAAVCREKDKRLVEGRKAADGLRGACSLEGEDSPRQWPEGRGCGESGDRSCVEVAAGHPGASASLVKGQHAPAHP